MQDTGNQRVDRLTIVGAGLLLMPLTTMWHEIGGHAAACAAQGGHVATLGAFYADCEGLAGAPHRIVALAGVAVDTALAGATYLLWRRATGDTVRLMLWLLWTTKAFVAAGYFCFSGVTGVGDLGPGTNGGIGPLPSPWLWRIGELGVGITLYIWLIRAAIGSLSSMVGDSPATRTVRRAIGYSYYLTLGLAAVVVGLFNPVGIFITIMSAAASSFGGAAGFLAVAPTVPEGERRLRFVVPRSLPVLLLGIAATLAFAIMLGPSIHL